MSLVGGVVNSTAFTYYDGSQPPAPTSNNCADLIKQNPANLDTAQQVWLPDRDHQNCLLLGPVIIGVTGAAFAFAVPNEVLQALVGSIPRTALVPKLSSLRIATFLLNNPSRLSDKFVMIGAAW